jgi:hypothetical protein
LRRQGETVVGVIAPPLLDDEVLDDVLDDPQDPGEGGGWQPWPGFASVLHQ